MLSLLRTPFPSLTEEQSVKKLKGCLSATFPWAAQLTDLQFSRVAGSLLGCLPLSRVPACTKEAFENVNKSFPLSGLISLCPCFLGDCVNACSVPCRFPEQLTFQ